jgi:hypothetical protein
VLIENYMWVSLTVLVALLGGLWVIAGLHAALIAGGAWFLLGAVCSASVWLLDWHEGRKHAREAVAA